jgi:hypothetical protein
MKRLAVLAVAAILSGCANGHVDVFGKIDPAEKVAYVPAGHSGVIGAMKKAMVDNGWTLVASIGDERVVGKFGNETDLLLTHERRPRYTFSVTQHVWNPCMAGENAVEYEVSIVDNRTGSEVAALTGRGDCWAGRNDGQIAQQIKGL